jgi:diadenosine tetraphosphatase ApaH/serine/threonine PP2A family protein phosphatase
MPLDSATRVILNPGSVGQPRDNNPRSAYAILDTEQLTWLPRRVAYPIEVTQAHMRTAGLPERLINRLEFGW